MRQTPLVLPKSITVNWSGKEPLAIPGKLLQPGDTTLPLDVWHSLGGDPVLNGHIAEGRLVPVHRRHQFAEGDMHCIGCSLTRAEAEAERKAGMPDKGKPAAGEPPAA